MLHPQAVSHFRKLKVPLFYVLISATREDVSANLKLLTQDP